MVRTDHEDGGVLKPEPDGTAKQTGTVRKSSPLSRRKKSQGKAPAPADASKVDLAKDEEQTADPSSEETSAVEATDAAETTASDDTAVVKPEGLSYRARRGSVKAPMSASPSLKRQVLPAVGIALGAVLLIASIVLTIVFTTASSRIDDDRELRAGYDQFAQEVVMKMTTLNKENADSMYKFMQEHTSGRAQQQFRESMKQATDLIRQDNMKTTTTVAASAVEKADEDAGSVLVVFVWQGIAPEAPQQPDVQTFRARISITRINDDLKMTNFEWVN